MKKSILLIAVLALVAIPLSAEDTEKTIKGAVVSCIKVVEEGGSLHETEPELFFWSESEAQEAASLIAQGYELARGVNSDILCGSYTPNIPVQSRDRDHVERAINYYKLIPEDGHKIWTPDIVFKKEEK